MPIAKPSLASLSWKEVVGLLRAGFIREIEPWRDQSLATWGWLIHRGDALRIAECDEHAGKKVGRRLRERSRVRRGQGSALIQLNENESQ